MIGCEMKIGRTILQKTPEAETHFARAACAKALGLNEVFENHQNAGLAACNRVKHYYPKKNLIFNNGLNKMADQSQTGGSGAALAFTTCYVGSGTGNPILNSGTVTFTQSGTTITASSNAFLATGMVNGILKYGSYHVATSTVNFVTSPGGTQATFTATIINGVVTGITIATAGSGQTPGTYNLVIIDSSSSGGTGATGQCVVAAGGTVTATPTLTSAGTGALEQYITSVNSSAGTCVVTGAGITFSTPAVATYYPVQNNTMTTNLYSSTSYQTSAGSCFSTFTPPSVLHQRVFIFNESAAYTVNEIGWSNGGGSATALCGRIILGSSDSVTASNIYLVTLQLTVTYSPSAPVASPNVGTGINTSGTLMLENMASFYVGSDGTVQTYYGNYMLPLDIASNPGYSPVEVGLITATGYTQNSTIATVSSPKLYTPGLSFQTAGNGLGNGGTLAYNPGYGFYKCSISTTTSGQTLRGLTLSSNTNDPPVQVAISLIFTTPVVLPVGAWAATIYFETVYARQLQN